MNYYQSRNLTVCCRFIHLWCRPSAISITACCLLLSQLLMAGAYAEDISSISYNPENCLKPPFIALDYHTASPTNIGNHLTWATLLEFGNSGFNVYRQEKNAAGEWVNKVQVNPDLIPAQLEARWGATYTFDDTSAVPGNTYYYSLEDVDDNGEKTWHEDFIAEAKPNEPRPAACLLYGVQDQALNDSIFFVRNSFDSTVKQLGQTCKGCDIEALAIHPVTSEIYLGSGDDAFGHPKGHLYKLDPNTGELRSVGNTEFADISGLAFDNQGILWAWAKGQGLATLDIDTGQGKLELPSAVELADLTWDAASQVLYGVIGKELWSYAPANGKVAKVCGGLPPKTEAVKTLPPNILPDGLVLLGSHHSKKLELQAYDIATCTLRKEFNLSIGYDDVEGLAMPVGACGQ